MLPSLARVRDTSTGESVFALGAGKETHTRIYICTHTHTHIYMKRVRIHWEDSENGVRIHSKVHKTQRAPVWFVLCSLVSTVRMWAQHTASLNVFSLSLSLSVFSPHISLDHTHSHPLLSLSYSLCICLLPYSTQQTCYGANVDQSRGREKKTVEEYFGRTFFRFILFLLLYVDYLHHRLFQPASSFVPTDPLNCHWNSIGVTRERKRSITIDMEKNIKNILNAFGDTNLFPFFFSLCFFSY